MKTHAANPANTPNAICAHGNAILGSAVHPGTEQAASRQNGSKSPETVFELILGLLPDLFTGREELYDGERYNPSAIPPAAAEAAAPLESGAVREAVIAEYKRRLDVSLLEATLSAMFSADYYSDSGKNADRRLLEMLTRLVLIADREEGGRLAGAIKATYRTTLAELEEGGCLAFDAGIATLRGYYPSWTVEFDGTFGEPESNDRTTSEHFRRYADLLSPIA